MRTLPIVLTVAALALSGCGGSSTSPASSTGTSPAASASGTGTGTGSSTAAALTVETPWVKATTNKMTGVFATLKNTGTSPVKIVSASSPVAGMTQLHVTMKDASGAMVMKETKDGFTIPAGGSFVLAPGSNHIMLMQLKDKVLSGVTIPVSLNLDGGGSITFDAQAREYSGAKETYAPTATVPASSDKATATAPGSPAASMTSSN